MDDILIQTNNLTINTKIMKKLTMIFLCATFMASSFTACREKKEEEMTEQEEMIQEMQDEGADMKVKENENGDTKIKMETDEKEVKIKTDADGDTKIKVDANN